MKKTRREISWSNIFYLVGIYFALIVMVVALMGGYLYQFLYETVYTDFEQKNKQHLSAVVKRHENDMKIVDNIVLQMERAESGRKTLLKDSASQIVSLKNQLKGYTNTSEFFDLMFYYYHNDSFLFHYDSSVSMSHFLNIGCFLENVPKDEWLKLMREHSMPLRILPEQEVGGSWINRYIEGSGKCTILLKTLSHEMEETLIFFVPDSYYNDLFSDSAFGSSTNVMYYNGEQILARVTGDVKQEDLDEVFKGAVNDPQFTVGSIRQEKVKVQGKEYLMSIQKGASGITYGTLQTMDVFYEKVRMERGAIFLLALICLLPAATIILLASRGFVRRIGRLNQMLNEETHYDLNSIEKGIQSLVMIRDESERENMILKKTRFIRNFSRGDFHSREDALEQAEVAEVKIDYAQYVIVLLKNREMNNENKAYSFMLEQLRSEEAVDGYGIHMINNNQNLFVLFGNEENDIKEALEGMLNVVKAYCEEYVFAVSGFHEHFADAPQAFYEADTAFDNHLLRDNNKIIYFEEINRADYVNLLPDTYLNRLKYAIHSSDLAAVEVVVGDICNQINRENVSLHAFRVFYHQIIHLLMSEWQDVEEQMGKYYNTFTLSQCMNLRDFHDILCEICKGIIDMKEGKNIKSSNVAEQAVAYMLENFQDPDLTMNALAEHLGVSSVTLSIEFKNEMAAKPSDYLATLRMEKAKELLRETELLIREVSLAVGYLDERVFMRRFKKYTGMTPGQYRGA